MNRVTGILCLMVLLGTFYSPFVKAQGCSDAGICSAGGMLPGSGKVEKGSVTLNLQSAVGEQGVKIFTPQLEGVMRLNVRNTFQLKVPYVFVSGNLGDNNGFGDIIAVLSHRFYDKMDRKFGYNIGARIGVNNANKFKSIWLESGINTLPMPYQTSLGTHDFLIGMDLKYKDKWLLALGMQVPVFQFNSNKFDTSLISPGSNSNAAKYFSSYNLKRKPDLVFRVDRIIKISEKLSFAGGVLAIYHLGHDRAINAIGMDAAIHGSKGVTINIPIAATYKFNEAFACIFRFATPVVVRKVRPDGLTRHYVIGLELKCSF